MIEDLCRKWESPFPSQHESEKDESSTLKTERFLASEATNLQYLLLQPVHSGSKIKQTIYLTGSVKQPRPIRNLL